MRGFILVGVLACLGAFAGCGGDAPPTRPTPQPAAAPPPPPPPPPANAAPVIGGITAQGIRRREPANLADAGEEIVLTASVTDAETPVDRLTFEWSSPAGAFSGTGPNVRWRAPSSVPSPFVAPLQLRVVDGDQRAERTVAVRVHDHAREVGDLATLFLREFSDSSIPAVTVMRNFLPGCYGTADELKEVEDNRRDLRIVASSIGPAQVTVGFDDVCPYQNRPGDACSQSRVHWESIELGEGDRKVVSGVDQVAAVYRQDRWWLCDSKFDPNARLAPSRLLELLTRPSSR